jgi:hypothetical protein
MPPFARVEASEEKVPGDLESQAPADGGAAAVRGGRALGSRPPGTPSLNLVRQGASAMESKYGEITNSKWWRERFRKRWGTMSWEAKVAWSVHLDIHTVCMVSETDYLLIGALLWAHGLPREAVHLAFRIMLLMR